MKCDQDLCLNFWYYLKKLLWQDELNPRVRCAFGNVLTKGPSHPPNNSTTANPNIYDSKVNFRRKIQFFKAKIKQM